MRAFRLILSSVVLALGLSVAIKDRPKADQPALTALPSSPPIDRSLAPSPAAGVSHPVEILKTPQISDRPNQTQSSTDQPTGRLVVCPILMYRDIAESPQGSSRASLYVPPDRLREQIAAFKNVDYHFVSLDELADGLAGRQTLPERPIALTFEDGLENFFTNAWPVIREAQVPATLFLISGRLDTKGYLSTEQVQELLRSELITIGANTVTHPDLTKLTAEQQAEEIISSKQNLSARISVAVSHFSYPAGRFTTSTRQIVAEAGFRTAVTMDEGSIQSADHKFRLKRLRVQNWTGESLVNRLTP